MPDKPTTRKLHMKWIGAVCLAVVCVWTSLMLFLDRYGQRDRACEARGAEAIIVLGARVTPNGEIGVSLKARATQAVALYRAELAKKIICTGGLGTYPPAESVATARWMEGQGVPAVDVLLEKTSTSTWQNLQNAALICRAQGWKRVIVVSDPYHLWRAERDSRALGLVPYVSPAPNQEWPLRTWMTFRETFAVLRDLTAGKH